MTLTMTCDTCDGELPDDPFDSDNDDPETIVYSFPDDSRMSGHETCYCSFVCYRRMMDASCDMCTATREDVTLFKTEDGWLCSPHKTSPEWAEENWEF